MKLKVSSFLFMSFSKEEKYFVDLAESSDHLLELGSIIDFAE
jgi:hypothetical protein